MPTKPTNTDLTSKLGLALAGNQASNMSANSTAIDAGTKSGAGTTTNTQSGKVFQNASVGSYTLANANAAASGGNSPVTGLSTATNPTQSSATPTQNSLGYFMNQTGGNFKQAQTLFNQQRQSTTNNPLNNYNQGLKAVNQLDSFINQESYNQNQRNQVKYAQDAQDKINQLNQQNQYQNQMNDLSYQNNLTNAQNNVDKQKQTQAYLAGGIGSPMSTVGLAGQNKDIADAQQFLSNLGLAHNLQNSSNASNLAYQINGIRKDIDLNVSSAVQNALVQIGKLDAIGDLNSVESVMKTRGDIMTQLQGIRQQMVEQNIPYLKSLMEQDQLQHTVDPTQTSLQNDGTLYNKFGQAIKGPNGQALKISNYTGTLMSSSPITLSDGSSALIFKNTDGSLRTEKIKDTGTMLSDDSVSALASLIAQNKISLGDIPKGMQDAVLSRMNNYNAAGGLAIGQGNLSGSELMKVLASGQYNGQKFFGLYASGDPTGQNRANIYTKAQNMGLDQFIAQYKGTPVTAEIVNNVSQKFGVDPIAVATIMAADSSMGTNWYGKGRGLEQNYNFGNVGQNDTLSAQGTSVGIQGATPEEKIINGVAAVAANLKKRQDALQAKFGKGTQNQSGTKEFTESQKAVMGGMDASNLSKIDESILAQNNLTATDVYNYKASQKANTWKAGLSDDTIKQVSSISKEFYDSTPAKKFDLMQQAYLDTKAVGTGNTGTDNQALIYAFAKAMDPDSVVREGEYAVVQKMSQTYLQRFGINIERALAGKEFISDEAKKDIVNTVKTKYESSIQGYENYRKTFATRIDGVAGKNIGDSVLTSSVMSSGVPNQNTSTGSQATIKGNAVEMPASNGKTYSISL